MDAGSLCVFVPKGGSIKGLLYSMSGYYSGRKKVIVCVWRLCADTKGISDRSIAPVSFVFNS